ncbi:hypothetical protein [Pseudarthrobacter sp. BRE9]|uniref:hypothetical protein n=1 Tax=Pseudarthrobacter sp. BRE9 TaxID=2962582 RepID=UPI002881C698|nr:hypothetical protein [Pseudarthrobacter sp. BRE9]MDT0168904.1 hypothetical protein [Pseudarthrobacter sp. BRE9]
MAVSVVFDGGDKTYEDGGSKEYHYLVSGGVLSIVEKDGDDWRVVREYSPNGWNYVDGTRRTIPLGEIPGSDGKSQEPASRFGRY